MRSAMDLQDVVYISHVHKHMKSPPTAPLFEVYSSSWVDTCVDNRVWCLIQTILSVFVFVSRAPQPPGERSTTYGEKFCQKVPGFDGSVEPVPSYDISRSHWVIRLIQLSHPSSLTHTHYLGMFIHHTFNWFFGLSGGGGTWDMWEAEGKKGFYVEIKATGNRCHTRRKNSLSQVRLEPKTADPCRVERGWGWGAEL